MINRRRLYHMRSIAIVSLVRLSLWILPFNTVKGIIKQLSAKPAKRIPIGSRQHKLIVNSVAMVSRFLPRATCLTQAIATLILLQHYDYTATLQIGVARDVKGNFEAHAWVESDGHIVIGGSKAELYEKYALLPSFR